MQETEGTFKIVGEDGILRGKFCLHLRQQIKAHLMISTCFLVLIVIPKANTLFTLSFPAFAFQTLPHSPANLNPAQEPKQEPEALPDLDASDPLAFLHTPLATQSQHSPHKLFQDSLKNIPKIEIDILGSAFAFRSEQRVGRKFKMGGVLERGWGESWLGAEVLGEGWQA